MAQQLSRFEFLREFIFLAHDFSRSQSFDLECANFAGRFAQTEHMRRSGQLSDFSQEWGDHFIDYEPNVEFKGASESASADIVSMAKGTNRPELEASMKIPSDSLVPSGSDSALRKIRLAILPTTTAAIQPAKKPRRVGMESVMPAVPVHVSSISRSADPGPESGCPGAGRCARACPRPTGPTSKTRSFYSIHFQNVIFMSSTPFLYASTVPICSGLLK